MWIGMRHQVIPISCDEKRGFRQHLIRFIMFNPLKAKLNCEMFWEFSDYDTGDFLFPDLWIYNLDLLVKDMHVQYTFFTVMMPKRLVGSVLISKVSLPSPSMMLYFISALAPVSLSFAQIRPTTESTDADSGMLIWYNPEEINEHE